MLVLPGARPLITDNAPAKTDLPGKPCLTEQTHGAVYRRLTYRRSHAVNPYKQLLDAQMSFGTPERQRNGLSLRRVPATPAMQKQAEHGFQVCYGQLPALQSGFWQHHQQALPCGALSSNPGRRQPGLHTHHLHNLHHAGIESLPASYFPASRHRSRCPRPESFSSTHKSNAIPTPPGTGVIRVWLYNFRGKAALPQQAERPFKKNISYAASLDCVSETPFTASSGKVRGLTGLPGQRVHCPGHKRPVVIRPVPPAAGCPMRQLPADWRSGRHRASVLPAVAPRPVRPGGPR